MKKKILTIILIIAFIALLVLLKFLTNTQTEKMLKGGQNTNQTTKTNEINDIAETSTESVVKEVTSQTFQEEVLNSEKTVLIDFYADWCGPCKALSPIIEEVAKENPNIKVVKVDVDLCQDLATKYNTMSIPTLVVIKNGEEADRVVGLVDKVTILDLVK